MGIPRLVFILGQKMVPELGRLLTSRVRAVNIPVRRVT